MPFPLLILICLIPSTCWRPPPLSLLSRLSASAWRKKTSSDWIPEHAAAPHRRESTPWDQARKPRQTLCAVVRQPSPPGGGVLFTLGGRLAASFGLADIGARHGWQRRGPRVHRPDAPCRLSRSSPPAGETDASRPEEHFPEDLHIVLVALIRELIPAGVREVLLAIASAMGRSSQQTLKRLVPPMCARQGTT